MLTFGDSNNATFSGIIQDGSATVAITKDGISTETLGGVNTYTGGTTIGAGTLQLGVQNSLPSTTQVTADGTLDLNGFSTTIGALSGNGSGVITSSTSGAIILTIGSDNGTAAFSGVIQNGSGTIALTKTGTGAETLSGVSTYTGATSLNQGTLEVDGSITSNVTVASGTSLDGIGTTGTVTDSGTVAPGTSTTPGTLSTGAVSFAAGSSFNVAIGSSTEYGQDDVSSGTVNITSGTGAATGVTLNFTSIGGFEPASGETYTIINNSGSSASPVSGTFVAVPGLTL